MHEELFSRAKESLEVDEYGDAMIHMKFLIDIFDDAYKYFLKICNESDIDIKHANYDTLYKIFIDCLIVKDEYIKPYINYFNKRLIDNGYEGEILLENSQKLELIM